MAVECAFTYLVRLFKYLERVLWLYYTNLLEGRRCGEPKEL